MVLVAPAVNVRHWYVKLTNDSVKRNTLAMTRRANSNSSLHWLPERRLYTYMYASWPTPMYTHILLLLVLLYYSVNICKCVCVCVLKRLLVALTLGALKCIHVCIFVWRWFHCEIYTQKTPIGVNTLFIYLYVRI